MNKLKNIAKWCGSILFFVFSIAMFGSKGGFFAGLFFVVAAIIINPLFTNLIAKNGIVLKKPLYITSIVLSSILAFVLVPPSDKSKEISTEPTQFVSQVDNTQESLSDLDKLSKGLALSENDTTADNSETFSESIDLAKEFTSVEQTEEPTWILNTKVKKIHYSTCRYAGYIQTEYSENSSLSLEELETQGYEPCKFCMPSDYDNYLAVKEQQESLQAKAEQERLEKLAQEQKEQARLEQERKAQEQAEKEKQQKEQQKKQQAEQQKKTEQQSTQYTWIINTKNMKIHKTTCSYLPKENAAESHLSLEELKSQGYEPCKKCNPK